MQLEGDKVILREKRVEDAQDDYKWRSDPELARLDAASPLRVTFDEYFRSFSGELEYPAFTSHSFSIVTRDNEEHIGNCMYYGLDHLHKEAEIGIIIGDRAYWNGGYGQDAVQTLVDHVFATVGLKKVYLHTLEWNHRARRCFAKCGFHEAQLTRRAGHKFVRMEMTLEEWEDSRQRRQSTNGSTKGNVIK
jgi:RimJ/RimL family protein N-acetyltransferase